MDVLLLFVEVFDPRCEIFVDLAEVRTVAVGVS